MPAQTLLLSQRSLPVGAALLWGVGLLLYQMTSLALGPTTSRQLNISLTIPAVDAEELAQPLISDVNLVLGMPAAAPLVSLPLMLASNALPSRRPIESSAAESAPAVVMPASSERLTEVKTKTRYHYHDADERSLRLARRR